MLFKKLNIPYHHMLDLLTSCICLYNMCIINLDGFDMDWDLKVLRKIQLEANSTFLNIK